MSAFNIPLEVKPPNIENPALAAQQAGNIQAMLQERNLRQQQIQANQMAMQEKALQAASQRALNQAIQANMKPGADGGLSLDHSGVMNTLSSQGFGNVALQFQGNANKVLAEQAKLRADQVSTDQKALEGVTQTLKGVTDDATYQAAKPLIQSQMQKWGLNVPLPDTYDPAKLGRLQAAGTTFKDALQATKDANDLARWKATDLRTGVDAFQKEYENELRSTTSQSDLKRVNDKYQAIANQAPEQFRGGYAAVLNGGPNMWTPDVPQRATDVLTTPAQVAQQKEEQARLTESHEATEARLAETRQAREESNQTRLDVAAANAQSRKDIAQMGIDFRRESLGNKTGSRLTPGQQQVEERNIAALEYGTANRPGLHSQRVAIGDQLKRGVDSNGHALDEGGRQAALDKLQSLTDTLQNTQFRKADLYGVGKPDPDDVKAAKDGDEIQATDGSLWKKQDGVAYYRGAGGGSPAAAPSPAPLKTPNKVRMRAPDGTIGDVDPTLVDHYKKQGATVVQ